MIRENDFRVRTSTETPVYYAERTSSLGKVSAIATPEFGRLVNSANDGDGDRIKLENQPKLAVYEMHAPVDSHVDVSDPLGGGLRDLATPL